MQQPEWADQLIKDVLFLHNRSKSPKIKWIQSKSQYSSGWTSGSRIKSGQLVYSSLVGHRIHWKKPDILIRQSAVRFERFVLLHELAHWLVRARHHHDKVFWRKAWDLYFTFLTDEELADLAEREFGYRGKALEVFQEFLV